MKVAIHAGQLLQPVPGGIGEYEIALLPRLAGVGVDATAFAAGPRPANLPRTVPWIDLGWPHGNVRYELWHRFRRPRLRIDVDVVHAPSLAIPPVVDRPLVVTVHDVAFLRVPQVSTPHGARFHRRGLDLTRRDAQLVIVPSMFTRGELEQEGFEPERIQVVPFGVDPPAPRDPDEVDRVVERLGAREPYVLTVGTIEPRKDLPTIVRAVERLRDHHPNLSLVVAGPRGWGAVHGLDRPFVRVVGAQPWSALDALYRRARVFCVASLYEGFGLPPLEAMARGIPTVATTGSSLEELVRGAGLLFSPGDVEGCAREIGRILVDDDLNRDLSRAARAHAIEMNWEKTAEGHARAYARALTDFRP